MRIVHIITGLNSGGAEATLYKICSLGADRDEHIVISLMGPGSYAERLEAMGVTVHCLMMPRGRVTIKGLATLHSLLRRMRPDLVQTWMYHADLVGGIAARLAGIKRVVW